MSVPSPTNSFKKLEEHYAKKIDAQMIHQDLNAFWKKMKSIKDDDIDLSDGDQPSE